MGRKSINQMSFASVYPHYITKAEKKGRTKSEVDEIIFWMTGYDSESLKKVVEDEVNFEVFFNSAPRLNPSRTAITGVICGVRIEEIEDPLMKEVRYLDKLIDELAKGKKMESILRKSTNPVEDYISAQIKEIQPRLNALRNALKEALPEANETISWRMPTYKGKKNIIHFAAFKNHIGIYPGDKAIVFFDEKLSAYKHTKGAIQFPYNEPLPLDLIVEIAKWCNVNQ